MKILKKISLLLIALVITFTLFACGDSTKKKDLDPSMKIGIIQFTQHPALDEAREGFEKEFEGKDVEIIYQNAQGDMSNIISITQKMLKENVDLIYAISTPVAQTVKNMVTDIPVVFTAVTDPVAAELVSSIETPGSNITGTSDEAPLEKQMQLFKDLSEDIKSIGIIYNSSEVNSKIQVDNASKIAKSLGLKVQSIGVNSLKDIPVAMDSISRKVDAIYTPTDNMIASSINIISKKAIENNIITIGAEKAHVEGGILISNGISYFNLGTESATMAEEILFENKDTKNMSIRKSENSIININKDTLNSLNIDIKEEILNIGEFI